MMKMALAATGMVLAVASGAMAKGAPASVCPAATLRVEVETGHSDPPATLVPDTNSPDGSRQNWLHLKAKSQAEQAFVTCYGKADKPLKKVGLPLGTRQCTWRSRQLRCS